MYDEGIYRVRAVSWGFKETTNGFDQFEMAFQVQGRVDRNDPDGPARPCEAGTRNWSITLKDERNVDWLSSNVAGLGFDGEDLLGVDPDQDGAFDFTGVEFLAMCKHREFRDETTEQWSVFQPRRKSLAKERVKDLNERFGHVFREAKARRAAANTPVADIF